MTYRPLGGASALVLIVLLLIAALPAAAQTLPVSACEAPLPLVAGQLIYTRPGIFVRNLPSISGGIANYYGATVTLKIVGGPVCADGYNWWQITGPDNPGWVAEGHRDFLLIYPDEDVFFETNDCPPPQLNLSEGDALRLTTAVRVRGGPGTFQGVVALLPNNTPMTVRGVSACVEGVNWWPVWAPNNNGEFVEAWVAETDGDQTVVEPVEVRLPGEVCAPHYRRLDVGVRAVVTYRDNQPKNLRAAPDRNAAVLNQLVDGIQVDIIGGPVCSGGLNWWQLQVVTNPEVSGWMAEGGTAAGGYWLFPLALLGNENQGQPQQFG